MKAIWKERKKWLDLYYRIIIKVINFKITTYVSNWNELNEKNLVVESNARFFYRTIIQIILSSDEYSAIYNIHGFFLSHLSDSN